MRDDALRKRMTEVNHIVQGFEPDTAQTIRECVVKEYLKDKSKVNRIMFEKLRPFIRITGLLNVGCEIEEERDREVKSFEDKKKELEADMVWIVSDTSKKPSMIRFKRFYEFVSESQNDKSYFRFLEYFYEYCVYYEGYKYCISAAEWNRTKKLYGEFLSRLLESERTFFTESGYFRVKQQISERKKKYKNKLEKLTENEREKLVAFQVEDGRWIKIV